MSKRAKSVHVFLFYDTFEISTAASLDTLKAL